MKLIFKIIMLSIVASLMSFVDKKKAPKTITTTIWVAGVCGLCEETIEKAMDTKGVVAADYILDTNTLNITYKPHKISESQIHYLLNEIGYDTDKQKCTEEQYLRTKHCCRYRNMEKH